MYPFHFFGRRICDNPVKCFDVFTLQIISGNNGVIKIFVVFTSIMSFHYFIIYLTNENRHKTRILRFRIIEFTIP